MTTTKRILKSIEQSWSIQKHEAQPEALPHEIQFQLQCSWGKAMNYANEIALRLRRPNVCPICEDSACETKSMKCGRGA